MTCTRRCLSAAPPHSYKAGLRGMGEWGWEHTQHPSSPTHSDLTLQRSLQRALKRARRRRGWQGRFMELSPQDRTADTKMQVLLGWGRLLLWRRRGVGWSVPRGKCLFESWAVGALHGVPRLGPVEELEAWSWGSVAPRPVSERLQSQGCLQHRFKPWARCGAGRGASP